MTHICIINNIFVSRDIKNTDYENFLTTEYADTSLHLVDDIFVSTCHDTEVGVVDIDRGMSEKL